MPLLPTESCFFPIALSGAAAQFPHKMKLPRDRNGEYDFGCFLRCMGDFCSGSGELRILRHPEVTPTDLEVMVTITISKYRGQYRVKPLAV